MRALCFCVAIALAGCATTTLPGPGDIRVPSFQFRVRDFVLPSGLRILLQEDKRSPHVAIVTVVGAGGSSDFEGREGLAHVVEHLAFRAQPERGRSTWRSFERLGAAEVNAYTALDETAYYTVVHKSALARTLELESRRLLHPLEGVSEEVFRIEREVVRNELRQRGEMQVEGEIVNAMSALLFDASHPYSRPVIGDHASLDAITIEDAKKFAEKYYLPSNMTMVIAGDVELESAEQFLADHISPEMFGDPKKPKPLAKRVSGERIEPPESPQPRARHLLVRDSAISRPQVWIGWTIPGEFSETAGVDGILLQHSLQAAIAIYLEDPEADIESFRVYRWGGTKAGELIVRVDLRQGRDMETSAEHVLNQVIRVWGDIDDLVTMKVQNRIRWFTIAQHAFSAEELVGRSLETAVQAHFTGNPLLFGTFYRAMVAMPPVEFAKIASRYLTQDRARVLYVTPEKTQVSTRAAPAGIGTQIEESESSTIAAGSPQEIAQITSEKPSRKVHFTLENGLEVWVEPARAGSVRVIASLNFIGGYGAEARPGEAIVERQVAHQHEYRRGSAFESGAASYSYWDRDRVTFFLEAPAGNLENALALLAERAETRDVDEEPWRLFHYKQRPALRADASLPQAKASRAFAAALFGDSGYGHVASADELDAVEKNDVEARIDRHYRPDNAILVIEGARDVVDAEINARKWFSAWGRGEGRVPAPQLAAPVKHEGPRVVITDHSGASQVRIQLGCVFAKADARRDATNDVLAGVVERGLEHSMRQELGVTYGVGARSTRLRSGVSELAVWTTVEAARIGEALRVIDARWSAWAAGASSPQLIDEARWSIARRRAWTLRSAFERNDAIARAIMLDGTPDAVDKYPAFLQAVAKPTIDHLLAECRSGLVVSLEGPEQATKDAIPAGWRVQ